MFEWVIVDFKKSIRGSSLISSLYVQLSRAKTRACLSILRPFDFTELRSPLSWTHGVRPDTRPAPGEEVTSLALGATRFNPRLWLRSNIVWF